MLQTAALLIATCHAALLQIRQAMQNCTCSSADACSQMQHLALASYEHAVIVQGWQPRVIWIGLGGCVFFTALEEAKKLYLPKEALQQSSSH